jgi:methyl-accepting chemotaxis protein
MAKNISVNALVKSVIALLVAVVVVVMARDGFESWTRARTSGRIAVSAEASVHMFTALAKLRLDRNGTGRDLAADQVFTTISPQIVESRQIEMSALRSALGLLETIDFPDRQAALGALHDMTARLEKLQAESLAALAKPKADRRAELAKDYVQASTAMIDMLGKTSERLVVLVRLEDSLIDQLLELKRLVWSALETAGEATLMISNPLRGAAVPPDAAVKYAAANGALDTMWRVIEYKVAGIPPSTGLTAAADKARQGFFSADYAAVRAKLLNALIAGRPAEMTTAAWATLAVAQLATVEGLAGAALAYAKEHALQQSAAATRSLWMQFAALLVTTALGIAMMLIVSVRVIRPLLMIKDAMLKLAGGDMAAGVAFGDRRDEIGALAGAMTTFRDGMFAADRLRAEQKDAEALALVEKQETAAREVAQRTTADEKAAAERKAAMQRLAGEFEKAVGSIIDNVSTAASQLEAAAGTLTKTAETTQQLAGVVTSASDEASGNVQSVAAATEQLSGSVGEISRQAQESSRIAGDAVRQAEKTDSRIAELSQAAGRIGDVVNLITAIAEQTNLLALNATIEAARAGEAGRGFAVVASEVKALAGQTAKATSDISTQIAGMQAATQESVAAIKEIGATIARIAQIAATIAAAVEEQGATTQEISRNVHDAATGTAQVADNIVNVNRGAVETGSASAQVLASAQSLSSESHHLKVEVNKFLDTVRAA